MSEVHTTPFAPHHQHALISWNAVLAGAAIAVAVGAMLNLLGMALGAAAIDPYELTRGEAEGFTVGAGVWIAIANAIALFVGGVVASRAAKHSDHHRGILNGLTVWAIAFLGAIVIAAATASGSVATTLGGAAEAAPEAARLAETVIPGDADRGTDASAAVPAPARQEAEQAADTTSAASLWGFLTMLLGAIAAALGGRYGSRKHTWETKAGIGDDAGRTTTVIRA